MALPFQSEIQEAFRTGHGVWAKILVCGVLGAVLIVAAMASSNNSVEHVTADHLVLGGLVGAALGMTIGMLLTLRDVCVRRVERGRPVNPILKLYLGSRGHSQIAWLVTILLGVFLFIWVTT